MADWARIELVFTHEPSTAQMTTLIEQLHAADEDFPKDQITPQGTIMLPQGTPGPALWRSPLLYAHNVEIVLKALDLQGWGYMTPHRNHDFAADPPLALWFTFGNTPAVARKSAEIADAVQRYEREIRLAGWERQLVEAARSGDNAALEMAAGQIRTLHRKLETNT